MTPKRRKNPWLPAVQSPPRPPLSSLGRPLTQRQVWKDPLPPIPPVSCGDASQPSPFLSSGSEAWGGGTQGLAMLLLSSSLFPKGPVRTGAAAGRGRAESHSPASGDRLQGQVCWGLPFWKCFSEKSRPGYRRLAPSIPALCTPEPFCSPASVFSRNYTTSHGAPRGLMGTDAPGGQRHCRHSWPGHSYEPRFVFAFKDANFLTLQPGAPYHAHTGKVPQRHGGQGSAPGMEALSGAASGAQRWPPQPPSHPAQPLATYVHHI